MFEREAGDQEAPRSLFDYAQLSWEIVYSVRPNQLKISLHP